MQPIYLDYAATTPIDPRVMVKMQDAWQIFGNPASQHSYGRQAKELIEAARKIVADLLNANPDEIIWTSGATESNNLAIKGAAKLYQRNGKHIITMKTEHKAVLDPCQHLEKNGYAVTYLSPESNGRLSLAQLQNAFRPDTLLVSIMHVNNETGITQDIDAISQLTAEHKVLLHVDAAQSVGKIPIDVRQNKIDLLSLCAHKIYGPKGIGALYLRKKPRVRVEPLMHGGGQEQGMRAGTLPTQQIIGLAAALEIAQDSMADELQRVTLLRNEFIDRLKSIPNFNLNTDLNFAIPNILNIRFDSMIADALLQQLPEIAASTASACQGQGIEGSYVLRAMGYSTEQIKNSIRISFGRFTTTDDVGMACHMIRRIFSTRK